MHSPSLDYRTLLLASGLVSATLLTLLAVQARKLYPGQIRMVVGIDLLTVAVVLADLRGFVSDALWIIQITSIFTFALIDSGIRLFCGSPRRGRWPALYVLAAMVLQTILFLTQPLYIRIFVNSLLLIPILIDASRPFLRTPPGGCRFGYRFTAAVLLLGCVASCVRMVAISYLHEHPSPFFSTHPSNTLFFLLIMFALTALAFGFIALTNERLVSELELTHEKFRLLYENAPLGIAMIDQNGRFTSANGQFAEISGFSFDEIVGLGLTAADLAAPGDKVTAEEGVEALLSRKIQVDDREMLLSRKAGGTIWVHLTAALMRENPRLPEWGVVAFQDISKRKQTEEALRQSEVLFTEKLQEYLATHQKRMSA